MAVTDSYATPDVYRDVVSKSDGGSDGAIEDDLKAVSRWLDKRLGRHFTRDATAQARVFTPPGALRRGFGSPPLGWAESENPYVWGVYSRNLDVDDIASTSGLSIKIDEDQDGSFADETALVTTDYELWPLNADKGPEPEPWTLIHIPNWSSKGGFPGGTRVQVTALWGWPAVPEAVVRATCHLTGILRLESPRATQRVSELGEVVSTSREARTIVDRLVDQYKRKSTII